MTEFKTHIKNIKESIVTLDKALETKRYVTAVQEAVEIQKILTKMVNKMLKRKG